MTKNLTFLALLFVTSIAFAQTSTLNRPNDPVLLIGAQLPSFSALQPNQIVGFKFVNGTWAQIPIQVDERALLDIVTPYGALAAQAGYPPSPSNPKVTFYTDATTNTGADPTATFDSDDELVFMAKDAGGQSDGSTPQGVVGGTCREIMITDPLGGVGYVYLFQNGGSLQQGAGVSYVTYTSNLSSTPGFPVNANITNIENTVITTSKYSWKFSAEWVSDEFKLIIGNNANLLDRYKNFFADGNCIRHEDAFSAAQNAYVTVKAGPIRVIRSYMGAVSGPLTQRTHWFYEGRQDIATDLRVHNIASIIDAFDYNSNANGMIYRNNLNTNGVTINGQPDVVTLGALQWEQVSGTQGTISILHRNITNMVTPTDGNFTSYYDDNSASPASNCTGDGQAWGTSGVRATFTGSICTDPMASGCSSQWFRNLKSARTVYADAPNGAANTASNYNNQFNNPLTVAIGACPVASANYTIATSSNPVAGGTTTGGGTYASGASVTVTATANGGYIFTNWTENGNVVSTNASYSFTISANRNLVANFSQNTTNYNVTTSSNPTIGGTTTGGGSYASGASVTVTATANSGYTFVDWTENGNQVSTNASYIFTISADRNLVANFSQNTTNFNVTTSSNPTAGGTTSGGGSYVSGASVTVTATANSGYTFVDWTENGNQLSTNASYTFTISADRNLVANFDEITSIDDNNESLALKIFPNPSSGRVIIDASFDGELSVFNYLGQQIQTITYTTSPKEILIEDSGVYFLLLHDKFGNRTSAKVIISK